MIKLNLPNFISPKAKVGISTVVEENTIISEGAIIGNECKIHRNIFIDSGVVIGNRVKIQDNVMIPHGVILEDGVFVGPSVAFTNDKYPRSVNVDGTLKTSCDWKESKTIVKYGASIGANSTLVCGITIGEWAMVGAGSVVTQNLPSYSMAVGNPAKIIKWVSKSGYSMSFVKSDEYYAYLKCDNEDQIYKIPISDYMKTEQSL